MRTLTSEVNLSNVIVDIELTFKLVVSQELLELRLSFADAWAVEICIDDELVVDDFEVVFEFAGWHIEVGRFEQLAFLELWRFDADEECAIAQFIEKSELRFGIGSSA